MSAASSESTIGARVMTGNGNAAAQEARDLLRRLAGHDERTVRAVLAPTPEFGDVAPGPRLDRSTRVLVRLAALLAIGASAESLCWAVELAAASGADDETVAAVLVAGGSAAGSAQLVASAAALAVALGLELEPEPADGSIGRADRRSTRGRRPPTSTPRRVFDTPHAPES
jgi:alkylhydroperoxidase/carboxymuconolactone decarboxylase family protein YurZ